MFRILLELQKDRRRHQPGNAGDFVLSCDCIAIATRLYDTHVLSLTVVLNLFTLSLVPAYTCSGCETSCHGQSLK